MGILAIWKLFLSESRCVSLAMSSLLLLNKDAQARRTLLQDLSPNPINCPHRGKTKWPKGPWNNTLKTQGSASAVEDCLGQTKPCKQYFWLENRSRSSTNHCMFVPKKGSAQDTEELLLSYFTTTARNPTSTSIGPCCSGHCRTKAQKYTESVPSHYALWHIIQQTKPHSIPVKYPRNCTDVSMVRRRRPYSTQPCLEEIECGLASEILGYT